LRLVIYTFSSAAEDARLVVEEPEQFGYVTNICITLLYEYLGFIRIFIEHNIDVLHFFNAKSYFLNLCAFYRMRFCSVPSKKTLHWANLCFSVHAIAQPCGHTTSEAFQAAKVMRYI